MKLSFIKKNLIFISLFSIFQLYLFADTKYTVQKGDTLYSISRKNQISVADLRKANKLSESDVIKSGQVIIIPSSNSTSSSSEKKSSVEKNNDSVAIETYVVSKGDTLYGISRKYGLTVDEILALNNLPSSTVIQAGQKLKVRKSESTGNNKVTSPVTVATEKLTVVKAPETAKTTEPKIEDKAPDTRNYGVTIQSDASVIWPVKNPQVTQVKGKVSGVQLSAQSNETVNCIKEGTVMYVGIYRGFGQVLFVQSQTGMIYAYTGLGSVSVKKGDYVVSGTDLGTAGVDSISGKSGITFMVFQNGQPIDPATAPRN